MNDRPVFPHRLLLPIIATAALTVAGAARAQRVMLPDDDGDRMLQLFDLRKAWIESVGRGPDLRLRIADGDPNGGDAGAESAREAARLLRHFVEPQLRTGDDLCAMGTHWIAVLADQERIASVERLFDAARRRREDLIEVEVRMLGVKAGQFVKHLAPRLTRVERGEAVSYESVIDGDAVAKFSAACDDATDEVLVAPRIVVYPLQRANMHMITQVSYVKDYEVEIGANEAVADPVIGVVWEGNKSDVLATWLPGGGIGLRCEV